MNYEEYLEIKRQRLTELAAQSRAAMGQQPVWTWEIGCGHGHYLADYAAARPDRWFVGVDLISRRITKSKTKRDKRDLDNLVFFKAEAGEFLESLPAPICFDEVLALFPDPWPKTKHHKNRLVQEPFLRDLAARCLPGARFCFRTDHGGYFEWASEVLQDSRDWEISPSAEWPFEAPTYFQNMMGAYQSLIAVRKQVAGEQPESEQSSANSQLAHG